MQKEADGSNFMFDFILSHDLKFTHQTSGRLFVNSPWPCEMPIVSGKHDSSPWVGTPILGHGREVLR